MSGATYVICVAALAFVVIGMGCLLMKVYSKALNSYDQKAAIEAALKEQDDEDDWYFVN